MTQAASIPNVDHDVRAMGDLTIRLAFRLRARNATDGPGKTFLYQCNRRHGSDERAAQRRAGPGADPGFRGRVTLIAPDVADLAILNAKIGPGLRAAPVRFALGDGHRQRHGFEIRMEVDVEHLSQFIHPQDECIVATERDARVKALSAPMTRWDRHRSRWSISDRSRPTWFQAADPSLGGPTLPQRLGTGHFEPLGAGLMAGDTAAGLVPFKRRPL